MREDFVVLFHPVDAAWAEWIVWQLEQGWYTLTRRPWDAGGEPLERAAARALEHADRVMFLYSDSMLGALRRAAPGLPAALADRALTVPVIVRPCAPAAVEPVLFAGLDEEAARAVLLEGARRGRPTEKPEPTRFDEAMRQSTRRPSFPAQRAPIYRMLTPPPPLPATRAADVARIDAALARGPAVLVPTGAPAAGHGVSSLARSYAVTSGTTHGVVWWVRAEAPHTLLADLAALAPALSLPERTRTDLGSALAAVTRWLADHDGWLLVLDDAPAPEAVPLGTVIPHHAGGRVLVTSARAEWPAPYATVAVEPLPDLPPAGLPGRVSDALTALALASPAALDLVRVASWLAPEDIPLKLFEISVPYLPAALAEATGHEELLHGAIDQASASGLALEVEETSLTMHAEVQRLVRGSMSPEARAATARAASALVCYGGSFFFHDGRSWIANARWTPHAHAVVENVMAAGVPTPQTLELARSVADAHANQGRLDAAIGMAEQALEIARALEATPARETSRCLTELAWYHGRAGDRPAKRALLMQALELVPHAEPAEVADRLIELAALHEACGEGAAGEPLLERAADLIRGQPESVPALQRLGALRAARGDLAGARAALQAALDLEELFGGNTTELAEALARIG